MKKGKFTLTVSSDNESVLRDFHNFMINDGHQQCLIYDDNGENCFYPEIEYNQKNSKDLDLFISCDFENQYEV